MKKLVIGLVLVALLLGAVSCAKAPEAEEGVLMPPAVFKGEGDYRAETTEIAQDRMIVRNGNIALVVEDVINTRDDIALLAKNLDGYVVSSQISGEEAEMRGWISIRVPDEKFELALAELRDMAVRVKSESTSSQDVTEEYIDLKSRLNNAEATEKQYLALLDKAENVEDILKIYDSLSRVRQEIEQIKGQMQYLERTSSMSMIEVYLEPQATTKPLVSAGWNALEVLKSALRGIVVFGQVLGTIAIWLIIFIPIWGTVLGIICWRMRKKKKTSRAKAA